jgi:tRNA(fMet)-specific endonuclease VapC
LLVVVLSLKKQNEIGRSMKYMLDTNICIYLIKKHPPRIVEKFSNYRKGEIVISSVTWAELCCGIEKDGREIINGILSILDVLPFDVEAGSQYGELSMLFPNRKANIDRMIAAHALSLHITLVTNNRADFAMYESSGLQLENWADEL